jgi:hypothetical protein
VAELFERRQVLLEFSYAVMRSNTAPRQQMLKTKLADSGEPTGLTQRKSILPKQQNGNFLRKLLSGEMSSMQDFIGDYYTHRRYS